MSPYDVIRGACITEKSETIRALEQTMCFRVNPSATKTDIRNAVQKIFKIKVAEVRTANYNGKMRRRGPLYRLSSELEEGVRQAPRGREDGRVRADLKGFSRRVAHAD